MGKSDEHILSIILYPDSSTYNSADRINDIWDAYYQTSDIAYILHDKDTGEKPHYHFILRYNSGNVSRDNFQRKYNISGCSIFNINEFREHFQLNPAISKEMIYSWDGLVRYLAHRTESAAEKYQYPISDIKANFDYTKYFKELNPDDPDPVIINRILSWAKKYQANDELVFSYVKRKGYFKVFHRYNRMIDSMLSKYGWYHSIDFTKLSDEEEVDT